MDTAEKIIMIPKVFMRIWCLFVKAAKQKCMELNVSQDKFCDNFCPHVDFTDMDKYDSGELDEDMDMPIDQAMLKDLVCINRNNKPA